MPIRSYFQDTDHHNFSFGSDSGFASSIDLAHYMDLFVTCIHLSIHLAARVRLLPMMMMMTVKVKWKTRDVDF